MPFKDSITTEELAALPETDRVLYLKKAGTDGAADSFTLHPSFAAERTALSANNKTLLSEKTAAATALKAFQDLNLPADKIAELKAAHEAAEAAKLSDADRKKAADEALKLSHSKELETVKTASKTREEFLTRELRKNMIEAVAKQAITEAGGQVKPLLPHIIAAMDILEDGEGDARGFVTRVMQADRTPRYVGSEFMTVTQLIEEYKRDEAFGGLFKASGAGGGGAQQQTKAAGGGSGVVLKRAAFAALAPLAQFEHVKSGGTVAD